MTGDDRNHRLWGSAAAQRQMAGVGIVLWALTLIAAVHAQTSVNRPSKAGKPGASKKADPIVEDWPVWGGKNRDFVVNTSGLADSWPASGPKKIWTRPLGDGYSAIAEEGRVLYTAFRRGLSDVITDL